MPGSISHSVRATYSRLTSALGPAPLSIFVSLMALTGAAWGVTLYQALSMSAPMGIVVSGGMAAEGMDGMAMSGMSAASWSFAGLAVFVTLWTVMMIAMMLPAAVPMILIFASAQARRNQQVAVPTWIFVTGYILVWGAAGLLVYVLVQIATESVSHLASLDRGIWAPLALLAPY